MTNNFPTAAAAIAQVFTSNGLRLRVQMLDNLEAEMEKKGIIGLCDVYIRKEWSTVTGEASYIICS
jgi:hypothetical protein